MKLSREILLAYVEGALPPEDARRVAAEVAKDGELHAYVETQKRLSAQLHAAFAPRSEENAAAPPPALEESPKPPPLLARLQARWSMPGKLAPHWIPALALTAGIALGVLLAGSFGVGADIRAQGGVLTAQGDLARVLTAQLSGDANGSGPGKIGASFIDKDGFFCRIFETAGPRGALAGIACREGGIWRIPALAQAERREATTLRPAGTDMPASIRTAMGTMIVGEPLSDEAERAARAQGWRAR